MICGREFCDSGIGKWGKNWKERPQLEQCEHFVLCSELSIWKSEPWRDLNRTAT